MVPRIVILRKRFSPDEQDRGRKRVPVGYGANDSGGRRGRKEAEEDGKGGTKHEAISRFKEGINFSIEVADNDVINE